MSSLSVKVVRILSWLEGVVQDVETLKTRLVKSRRPKSSWGPPTIKKIVVTSYVFDKLRNVDLKSSQTKTGQKLL